MGHRSSTYIAVHQVDSLFTKDQLGVTTLNAISYLRAALSTAYYRFTGSTFSTRLWSSLTTWLQTRLLTTLFFQQFIITAASVFSSARSSFAMRNHNLMGIIMVYHRQVLYRTNQNLLFQCILMARHPLRPREVPRGHNYLLAKLSTQERQIIWFSTLRSRSNFYLFGTFKARFKCAYKPLEPGLNIRIQFVGFFHNHNPGALRCTSGLLRNNNVINFNKSVTLFDFRRCAFFIMT